MIFSLNIRVQTKNFGRQRGFLLDGEDPPEEVGCRKESFFLEFMYVDVARDFGGVVLPPHSLNLNFQVFVFVKLFRGFD